MAHQGMPGLFLDTNQSVKTMVRTCLIALLIFYADTELADWLYYECRNSV